MKIIRNSCTAGTTLSTYCMQCGNSNITLNFKLTEQNIKTGLDAGLYNLVTFKAKPAMPLFFPI